VGEKWIICLSWRKLISTGYANPHNTKMKETRQIAFISIYLVFCI